MAWIESFATDLHIGRHYWTWQRLFFRTQWRSQFRSQTVCQTRSCKCTWRQRQRWQSVCNLMSSEDKLIGSYHLAVAGYSTDTSCIQFAYIHLKIPTIFQHITPEDTACTRRIKPPISALYYRCSGSRYWFQNKSLFYTFPLDNSSWSSLHHVSSSKNGCHQAKTQKKLFESSSN